MISSVLTPRETRSATCAGVTDTGPALSIVSPCLESACAASNYPTQARFNRSDGCARFLQVTGFMSLAASCAVSDRWGRMFGAGGVPHRAATLSSPPSVARAFCCARRPLRARDRLARGLTDRGLDEPVAPGYVLGPSLGARLSCITARSTVRSRGLRGARSSKASTYDLACPLRDDSHDNGMPRVDGSPNLRGGGGG